MALGAELSSAVGKVDRLSGRGSESDPRVRYLDNGHLKKNLLRAVDTRHFT